MNDTVHEKVLHDNFKMIIQNFGTVALIYLFVQLLLRCPHVALDEFIGCTQEGGFYNFMYCFMIETITVISRKRFLYKKKTKT